MIVAAEHPTAAELTRYAVAEGERSETVRRHLENGCGACLLAVRRFREIVAMSEAEPLPDTLDWIAPRRVVLHREGQRGATATDVQLVCDAGPFQVDILVRESARPDSTLEIVGQVTRGGRVFEPAKRLPVLLVEAADSKALAATATDDDGEFDVRCRPEGIYGIRLGTAADAPCILVWGGSAE